MRGFLRNPGLELGDTVWGGTGGWTIVNEPANARSGVWVARSGTTVSGVLFSPAFAVRPGCRVNMSGWFQTLNLSVGTLRIITSFTTQDGTFVEAPGSIDIGPGLGYTFREVSGVAPARAKLVSFRARQQTALTGHAFFDDADAWGDIIEELPSSAVIRMSRIIQSRMTAAFTPLVGPQKFTEFNGGASDLWSGLYQLVPVAGADLDELAAFLTRLGRLERFFAYDPRRTVPAGGVVNGMVVDGAGQSGPFVNVRSGPASSTPLKAGEYVEIGAQYCKLVRDLELGSAGTGTLHVWPSLRTAPADGEDVVTNNPKMVARITSELDTRQLEARPTELAFSWEEVA